MSVLRRSILKSDIIQTGLHLEVCTFTRFLKLQLEVFRRIRFTTSSLFQNGLGNMLHNPLSVKYNINICIHLRQTNKKWPVLVWKWEQCDRLESPALHGIGRCFSAFGIWARTAPQVINESTSLTTIKKTSICQYLITPSCA